MHASGYQGKERLLLSTGMGQSNRETLPAAGFYAEKV
jgi:hypothetical protein